MDLGQLETNAAIAATFNDVREAKQAFVLCVHSSWTVFPLNPREAAFHQRALNARDVSAYEGQIIISLFYDERDLPQAGHALAELQFQLGKFGDIKAMCTLPQTQRNVREFRIEFFDLKATTRLLLSTTIAADVSRPLLFQESY